jgi:hypothetical protein
MWPKDKLEHGWSINYDFLNQVQSFITENESLSLEDIENVLLATEKIEVLKPSHNKQSTPLCSCGAEASFWSCDKCFDQYVPHP